MARACLIVTRLGQRIAGSIVSALFGWLALALFLFCNLNFDAIYASQGWRGLWISSSIAAVLISGTWLILLLPLYLFVPLHSQLWRWPICTVCGLMLGALIIVLFCILSATEAVPRQQYVELSAVGAGVGGISCLFGSLTKRYFQFLLGQRETKLGRTVTTQ